MSWTTWASGINAEPSVATSSTSKVQLPISRITGQVENVRVDAFRGSIRILLNLVDTTRILA